MSCHRLWISKLWRTNRSLLIQWLTFTVDVGVTLECVATWSRDVNRTYVIARQVNTRHADCYVSNVMIVVTLFASHDKMSLSHFDSC